MLLWRRLCQPYSPQLYPNFSLDTFSLTLDAWFFILEIWWLPRVCLTSGGSYWFFMGHSEPFSLKVQGSLYFRICVSVCACVGGWWLLKKMKGVSFSHTTIVLEVDGLTDNAVVHECHQGRSLPSCIPILSSFAHFVCVCVFEPLLWFQRWWFLRLQPQVYARRSSAKGQGSQAQLSFCFVLNRKSIIMMPMIKNIKNIYWEVSLFSLLPIPMP